MRSIRPILNQLSKEELLEEINFMFDLQPSILALMPGKEQFRSVIKLQNKDELVKFLLDVAEGNKSMNQIYILKYGRNLPEVLKALHPLVVGISSAPTSELRQANKVLIYSAIEARIRLKSFETAFDVGLEALIKVYEYEIRYRIADFAELNVAFLNYFDKIFADPDFPDARKQAVLKQVKKNIEAPQMEKMGGLKKTLEKWYSLQVEKQSK